MIYLGADHGGFPLKAQIAEWLTEWKLPFVDLGAHTLDPADDYPAFAFAVAEAVSKEPNEHKGILACRSAGGVVIAANKVRGIRAVAPFNNLAAQHSREHNDANVLGLSGDWLQTDEVKQLLRTWLDTPFSGDARHARRLQAITDYEL